MKKIEPFFPLIVIVLCILAIFGVSRINFNPDPDPDRFLVFTGTIVDVEYIFEKSQFGMGSDIRQTIFKLKDDRVIVVDSIAKEVILNKPVKVYQPNYLRVWMERSRDQS